MRPLLSFFLIAGFGGVLLFAYELFMVQTVLQQISARVGLAISSLIVVCAAGFLELTDQKAS